jgi:Fe/S biogenesis protein NfuA
MGLFRRWFGGTEQKSGEAVASPAAPETLEQHGGRNAVSDVSARGDAEQGEDSRIRAKIQDLLDTAINPAVAGHGGVVSLVDVKDKMVYLQMGGGCQGCGMVDVTLKQGIETMIREELPEVVEILDVTDHAAGQNPYSAASKK